jgi:hypothetical protein
MPPSSSAGDPLVPLRVVHPCARANHAVRVPPDKARTFSGCGGTDKPSSDTDMIDFYSCMISSNASSSHASSTPLSLFLPCRVRSRPAHHLRTFKYSQHLLYLKCPTKQMLAAHGRKRLRGVGHPHRLCPDRNQPAASITRSIQTGDCESRGRALGWPSEAVACGRWRLGHGRWGWRRGTAPSSPRVSRVTRSPAAATGRL